MSRGGVGLVHGQAEPSQEGRQVPGRVGDLFGRQSLPLDPSEHGVQLGEGPAVVLLQIRQRAPDDAAVDEDLDDVQARFEGEDDHAAVLAVAADRGDHRSGRGRGPNVSEHAVHGPHVERRDRLPRGVVRVAEGGRHGVPFGPGCELEKPLGVQDRFQRGFPLSYALFAQVSRHSDSLPFMVWFPSRPFTARIMLAHACSTSRRRHKFALRIQIGGLAFAPHFVARNRATAAAARPP